MTATTQGLAGQGLASGIPVQQGTFGPGFGYVGPGFPPPVGAEQFVGLPSPYAVQPQLGYQQQTGMFTYPQAIQQLAAQVVPIAQQAILPQVIALVMQQVQQQLPQLIALVNSSMAGQPIGQWPHPLGWQQPASGFFGQVRPYAYG